MGLVSWYLYYAASCENHCLKSISRDTGFEKEEEKGTLKSCRSLYFKSALFLPTYNPGSHLVWQAI